MAESNLVYREEAQETLGRPREKGRHLRWLLYRFGEASADAQQDNQEAEQELQEQRRLAQDRPARASVHTTHGRGAAVPSLLR